MHRTPAGAVSSNVLSDGVGLGREGGERKGAPRPGTENADRTRSPILWVIGRSRREREEERKEGD